MEIFQHNLLVLQDKNLLELVENKKTGLKVRLSGLDGKVLMATRVSGHSSLSLRRQHQARGVYWLSIYVEKKNQLLGSVQIMKDYYLLSRTHLYRKIFR